MNLDEYISQTRVTYHEFRSSQFYDERIIEKIKDLLLESGIKNEIYITYSTDFRCETVELDGVTHIIYDQNLGQATNFLNRIFFESTESGKAFLYAHKIVAQLMIGYDFLKPEALHFCSVYNRGRKPIPQGSLYFSRLYATNIQETYTVVHEIFHKIYSNVPRNKIFDAIEFEVGFSLEEFQETTQSYIDSPQSEQELREYFDSFPDAFLGDSVETALGDHEKSKDFWLLSHKRVSESQLLKEEIFCDHCAGIWVLMMYSDSIDETLSAIYLAHYNLRVITHLRKAVQNYVDFFDAPELKNDLLYFVDTFVRSRYILRHFTFLKEAFLLLKENAVPIEQNLGTMLAVEIAYKTVRLKHMSEPTEDNDKEKLSARLEDTRRTLIQLQAKYYSKVYGEINHFIAAALHPEDLIDTLNQKLGNNSDSLELIRSKLLENTTVEQRRQLMGVYITGGPKPENSKGARKYLSVLVKFLSKFLLGHRADNER